MQKVISYFRRLFLKPKSRSARCWVEYEEMVLLVRNAHGSGYWNLPGGGIEEGESPEIAVRREVREELNVELESVEVVVDFEISRSDGPHRVYVCAARALNARFTPDPAEILEARWFSVKGLPELRAPAFEAALERVRGSLRKSGE